MQFLVSIFQETPPIFVDHLFLLDLPQSPPMKPYELQNLRGTYPKPLNLEVSVATQPLCQSVSQFFLISTLSPLFAIELHCQNRDNGKFGMF